MKSFVREATTFCRLIEEHRQLSRKKFLSRISVVLPRIYAWACELPQTGSKGKYPLSRVTRKKWNACFESLMRKLGPYDKYWDCFNPYVEDELVARSLADDLADIYGDLKPGLVALVSGEKGATQAALWEWRLLFDSHWAHHATGALRAVQQLASECRLI
jgi:hypothetical protein